MYMPKFKSEEAYNEWMKEQSSKIPRDSLGMVNFKDEKEFKKTLESLGIENVEFKGTIISGTIKD